MTEKFDIEERWPELFAPLDQVQKHAVLESLAAGWHEGWNPTRQDVVNLIDHPQDLIDDAEYLRGGCVRQLGVEP